MKTCSTGRCRTRVDKETVAKYGLLIVVCLMNSHGNTRAPEQQAPIWGVLNAATHVQSLRRPSVVQNVGLSCVAETDCIHRFGKCQHTPALQTGRNTSASTSAWRSTPMTWAIWQQRSAPPHTECWYVLAHVSIQQPCEQGKRASPNHVCADRVQHISLCSITPRWQMSARYSSMDRQTDRQIDQQTDR